MNVSSLNAVIALTLTYAPLLGCKKTHTSHDKNTHHEHKGHEHKGHEHKGHEHKGHEHKGHEHKGHENDPHAQQHITLWGERTQLFARFPKLVAHQDSVFSIHLTRLTDHRAIAQGSVVLELTGGGHPPERFGTEHATKPGLFHVKIRPKHTGGRTVAIRIDSNDTADVHFLNELQVFETHAQTNTVKTPHQKGSKNTISYSLEQQWKIPFGIARAEAKHMRPNIPAFAQLMLPSNAEAIITAPRHGRIIAIDGRFPRVGEDVHIGERLFAQNSVPQDEADQASLDLAVDQANIQVQAAQREVNRILPLLKQGVVSPRRVDDAQSALAASKAKLRSARRRKNNLGQSQKLDAKHDALSIPCPIKGTIAQVYAAPGAWVKEGQPIARIVQQDKLWLEVGVPEAYIERIRKISGVWFTLGKTQTIMELPKSALVSIGPKADPITRTLPVRFRVDNIRAKLFAGMTALAHLITAEPQMTVAIPAQAVVDDSGTDVVYVQVDAETFERRIVQLGMRDGAYVEIKDGLKPGEWIVAQSPYSIKLAATKTKSLGHGHAH